MKALNGAFLIRRIDGLGRIVIPKEIRKTMHIKNGDNLEIFIQNDHIILKKYSEIDNLTNLSEIICNTLTHNLKSNIFITNTDKFINVSKVYKLKYQQKQISTQLLTVINKRKQITLINAELKLTESTKEKGNFIITPIIVGGDVIGSIIIYDKQDIDKMAADKISLITNFFTNYIEE